MARSGLRSADDDEAARRRGGEAARPRLRLALRAMAVGTVLLVAAVVTIGTVFGWSRSWNWVESQWRLDIGAPSETAAYPDSIGDPTTRLVAAGDVGTGGAAEYKTAKVIDGLEASGDFDALLLLGDNVYPSGDPASVETNVLDPFAAVLDGPTQLVAALGNHDVQTGDGEPLLAALDQPARWRSVRFGAVRVVVVDSTRPRAPDQLTWLRDELGRPTDSMWTVVMQHHPPFSAGYHGSHGPSRDVLVPIYEEFGVDLVLAGHDHDYQRTAPQNGVTYVVTGGAAKLRPTAAAEFTATAASTYSFVELAAFSDRLEIRAVDHDGRVIDSFDLAA